MAKLNYHIPLSYLAYLTLIFHFISCQGYTSNIEAPDSVKKGTPAEQVEALHSQQDNLWNDLKNLEEHYNDLEEERIHIKSLETENTINNDSIESLKEKQKINLAEQKKIIDMQQVIIQQIRDISNEMDAIVLSRLRDLAKKP